MCLSRRIILTVMLATAALAGAAQSLSALYACLDSLLEVQDDITRDKQMRIAAIASTASGRQLSPDEAYRLNEILYNEYIAFRYDSALHYAALNVDLAKAAGDYGRLCDSRIKQAHITSMAGLFDKAQQYLDSVDCKRLDKESLSDYYDVRANLCQFMLEFAQGTPFEEHYRDSAQYYREKTIALAKPDSFEYAFSRAVYVSENGDPDGGIAILLPWLVRYTSGDRNYAIVASTLAYFYQLKGDSARREHYLLLSAISDVRGAVRENISLRSLSLMLFDEGDLDRAFNYLNASINDAVFYGTRLRNIQSVQLAPLIIKAYNDDRSAQHRRTQLQLVMSVVVMLVLAVVLAVIAWLMKKRRVANAQIELMNGRLQDTVDELRRVNTLITQNNRIKDEYIVRFLLLCSNMIDRAEHQRKDNLKLARERKTDALLTSLKSTAQDSENVKLFHENFDTAFLNIFPHFVSQVNALLRPDENVVPERGLSTELRILALMRLGITDNATIAGILRASISTIYTYRSRLKARAVEPHTFEAAVKTLE